MARYNTIAIVGVGLIGGSIGLALLRRRLAREVVGIGRRESSLRKARAAGAVTRTTRNLARGVAGAELVVACTPVGRIAHDVLSAAEACADGALLTDAGSTKSGLVAEVVSSFPHSAHRRGVRFLGSHPLAGSEKSGPGHARDDLFEGCTVVITPTRGTTASDKKRLRGFWRSLGAEVQEMSPAAHDKAVATISHLPHLVAASLAASGDSKHRSLAAGGWLDTTRIAQADPELWRQIFESNRLPTLRSLERFEQMVAKFRQTIERGDWKRLESLLGDAKRRREAVDDDGPS